MDSNKLAGLDQWIDFSEMPKSFFGTIRDHFTHEGITYWADIHVSDHHWQSMDWKERLFSWPWRPWISHKIVYSRTMFFIDNGKTAICSFTTLMGLIKEFKIEQ